MRIFWISSFPTQAHRGGGGAYSRSLRHALARALPEATVTIFEPPGGAPAPLRRARQALSLARAQWSPQSAKLLFDTHASVRRALLRSNERPDGVLFDGLSAAAYDDLLPPSVPRLVIAHNLEFELYRAQLASLPRPLSRLLGREARKHEAFERGVLRRAAAAIAISADEAQRLPELAGKPLPVRVILPSFGEEPPARPARAEAARPLRLGFVGKLDWWPNREGLQWFIRELWPQVSSSVELHVYGMGSDDLHGRGVHGHGFVENLDEAWRMMDVMINPVRLGAGTNVKVCEALYQGVPVLSAPAGLRGLPELSDPALRGLDGADAWQRALAPAALRAFAATPPTEETRALFTTRQAVETLRALVTEVLP